MSGRIMASVAALVIAGIRRHAPAALGDDVSVASLGGDETGVPLDRYRVMLAGVYERAGGAPILAAGRTLEQVSDPILFVLLNSDSVELVIEKEARLARFIHSRHSVRIVERDERAVVLEHGSAVDDPPRFTENLASAGQHVVLLEQIGCRDLELRLPLGRDPELAVYAGGTYREPGATGCQRWRFSWSRFEPTRRPMPGLDELLLSGESRPVLAEVGEATGAMEAVIRSDLARTWTVRDVAARLATSPRSLQRALTAESTRFTDVVDRLRVAEARRLLASTELTVTEIGYVCGFADTAHLSRRFKQRLGQSPSAYRARPDGSPSTR